RPTGAHRDPGADRRRLRGAPRAEGRHRHPPDGVPSLPPPRGRLGAYCAPHPTGFLSALTHEVDVMAAADQVDMVAVFGPEHGFRGTAQAGGSEGSYVDARTGLTVWDTYLKSGPALADIVRRSGVDTLVFDIQDAGARFYTYIWTLYDCM